jgi:hypothetical protein
MAASIPSDHIITKWSNSVEEMRKSYALQINLLLLFNDINEHSVDEILSGNQNYGFFKEGFGINPNYLEALITSVGKRLSWSMAVRTALLNQSRKQQTIPEIDSAIYSDLAKRAKIFNPALSRHLLHRYRHTLKPKIQLGEITL